MIVYIVLIPLLTALITPILGMFNKKTSFYLALLNAFATFFIVILTIKKVYIYGPEKYWFGGFEPPYGIEYVVDSINAIILFIISLVFIFSVIYSKKSLEEEVENKRLTLMYTMINLYYTGILGITITGDIFNLYVFIEITSLSAYTLIAMGKNKKALMASYNYLILGTIGATFILIGIGYIFMATGSLNMYDIKLRLPAVYSSKMVRTGFAFLTLGLCLKLALFPLHTWLPNAYTYAPSAIGALLAGTGTKVSAYALIRILYSVFTLEFDSKIIPFNFILLILSCVAIISGSFLAISQKNLKKMLAYSSVGQIGYISLGLSIANLNSLQGSIIHIFNHSLMKVSLFFIAGGIFIKYGYENINELKGIGRKMPYTMFFFLLSSMSLVGIPFTSGFISKWYLILGALEQSYYLVIPVIIISSSLSFIYLWRVIEMAYFDKKEDTMHDVKEVPLSMLVPIGFSSLLCVFFGIYPKLPISLAEQAANIILGK
mgnify:CR=1 FL=1